MLQCKGRGDPALPSAGLVAGSEMDIEATGEGFGATEVQFAAITDAGKAAMAKIGGFACIGMTIRKSSVGQMLDRLAAEGVTVRWA